MERFDGRGVGIALAMLAVLLLWAVGVPLLPAFMAGIFVAAAGLFASAANDWGQTDKIGKPEPVPNQIDRLESARLALSALDSPCIILDRNGDVQWCNAAASTVFGPIDPGQHISFRLRSPGLLDMVRAGLISGQPTETDHLQRLPSEDVYRARLAPALDEAGQPAFFVLSFRDTSEARRIERMRSDFVANASHELRTPLASLRGFIETLQGPARNDETAREKFLGIMLEQANRMSRLVDDLLSLSRLELKSRITPDARVELGPVLSSVAASLGPLAEELGVAIRLDMPDHPVIVTGDRDELTEVFENLIENACKYGQDGKTVDVKLTGSEGEAAEVSVTDHGPGIAAEHVPRLTERFYRINVEASRYKKGTGLGLAIVKHILTRHKAILAIRSEPGKGSTFSVRF